MLAHGLDTTLAPLAETWYPWNPSGTHAGTGSTSLPDGGNASGKPHLLPLARGSTSRHL